jgi:AcrR family transcriptional regulator
MADTAIPVRGRPRSVRSHRAILDAANELLEERGLVGLTIDEVAQLARQPLPDTGSLRGDLLAALRSWIRVVNRTVTGRTLKGLIAEVQRDPELAEIWRIRFTEPVRAQHRTMLDRAIERGEISPRTDPDVVLDLIYGPAYHRLLQSHLPLNDRFARGVVDIVIAGVRPDTSY